MAFSDSFLDDLTARTDIVELISRQVSLKKRGDGFWGLCPFHGEKTPSFHVLPDRQIFHCFGCGVGGGVIQFVQRSENLSFMDAVSFLAERAGVAMPEDGTDNTRQIRETISRINRHAARWFHQQLKEPQGSGARAYISSRGLTAATVTRFGLGWAPDSWDGLVRALNTEGFSIADLVTAGLAVASKDGGAHDRFRGRLIFPIIDLRRQVIAFGGRTLGDGTPKYLNSPDTLLFSKRHHLFALSLAKNTKDGKFVLAEGYMDVLALHQAGFDGAVASLGTALTTQQASLLSRYAKEVVIAFDIDQSGKSATGRALGILEQSAVRVRVLRLDSAKDPDEYIRRYGREAFASLLAGASTQTEYKLALLAEEHDLATDEGRLLFCRKAAALLCTLESEAERVIYTAQAARLCALPEEALRADVSRARENLGKQKKRNLSSRAMRPELLLQPLPRTLRYENARSAVAEEGVVRMVFSDPPLIELASTLLAPDDFSDSCLSKLFSWALDHPDNPGTIFSAGQAFDEQELSHLTGIMQKPVSFSTGAQALRDCASVVLEQRTLLRSERTDNGEDLLMTFRRQRKEVDFTQRKGGTNGNN